MARLFIANKVTRAANVEVMARKLKPCTQAVEVAKYLQPFLCRFRQHAIGFVREIGVGASF